MNRERRLVGAFVAMADTLVDEFDVIDLLQGLVENCVELLSADAAGLLLADQRGGLQVIASSSEDSELLDLFQLQNDEGPCLDCYNEGAAVLVPDLAAAGDRWPRFVPEAQRRGFNGLHALPLRLRSETIGALNLFFIKAGSPLDEDVRVAQGLADVATIGILQDRTLSRSEALSEQLQGALNSRVVIEQAKGVLAERGGLDMETAFAKLLAYSRGSNLRLREVAASVVDGSIDMPTILSSSRAPKRGV